MKYRESYSWPASKAEAVAVQKQDAEKVDLLGNFDDIKLIAAVETTYGTNAEVIFASAVVVTFPEIEEVERVFQFDQVTFPYIPGLFYFREGPTMLRALAKLESDPDLIIVHGHGIAHPNRCGMASQIGIALDKPTVGCCRKLLAGYHRPLPPHKGTSAPITLRGKEVGWAYRSKEGVKPIFISPGHKCSIDQARDIVLKTLRGFRMPEPLRLAHLFANKFRRHTEKKINLERVVEDEPA